MGSIVSINIKILHVQTLDGYCVVIKSKIVGVVSMSLHWRSMCGTDWNHLSLGTVSSYHLLALL